MRGVAWYPQALERDLAQSAFDVPVGHPLDGLAVKLGVGSVRAELAGSAEFEGKMAGADNGDALIAGPGFDQAAQGAAKLDEPPGLRKRRGEDIRVDGHDGQVRLRTRGDDGAGDAVVNAQFIAEREVKAGVQAGAQQVRGELFMPLEDHAGQSEFALLIVVVCVIEWRFAYEELRHIIVEELMEMV